MMNDNYEGFFARMCEHVTKPDDAKMFQVMLELKGVDRADYDGCFLEIFDDESGT